MKILVTFFCILLGLVILFATVDLAPFLTQETFTGKTTAVNSNREEMASTDASHPPPAPQGQSREENLSAQIKEMGTSEPGLSRITTHQLIVTEKRDNKKFGHGGKIDQKYLPPPDGNISAPDAEESGK